MELAYASGRLEHGRSVARYASLALLTQNPQLTLGALCFRSLRELQHYGCVMSSGFTSSSNFSAVSSSNSTADSFNEIPFLCAFFAIFAALS